LIFVLAERFPPTYDKVFFLFLFQLYIAQSSCFEYWIPTPCILITNTSALRFICYPPNTLSRL
jgi:hypothetical protein